MTDTHSALYTGSVMHSRLRPHRHLLRYRMFSLLLDLDELDSLHLRWLSINRFNLFSFHERDHGEGTERGLKRWVEDQLRAADLPTDGRVQLFTMPRILRYVFNPLSLYFCRDAQGELLAIIYEVNNTFGERHSYLLEVSPEQRHCEVIQQHCDKVLHVSPFMAPDMVYHFRVSPPAQQHDSMSIGVDVHDDHGLLLATQLRADRCALSDTALVRVFFSFPLLTLKVVAGIHWEALRLWLKGLRVYSKPAGAPSPISIVKTRSGRS